MKISFRKYLVIGITLLALAFSGLGVTPAQAQVPVWSLGTEWQIGSATASSGQNYGNPDPAADHTPTADNYVAGVVIGGNANRVIHGYYYLTSPIIDTSSAVGTLTFEYYRWLNSDFFEGGVEYMQNIIEVWDGSSWVTLWITGAGPGVRDNSWVPQSFDITPYRNPNLQIRFGFRIGNSTDLFTVSSWNIDDVRIYTPTQNFLEETFSSLTIINHTPVCQAVTLSTDEDTLGTTAPNCSDLDGDPLTYSIASQPSHGTVAVVAGQLEYTPGANYNGSDSFTYIANDGTVASTPATVSVTVSAVNDGAPVCQDVTLGTDEDTAGTTAPNCADVDGDPLTYDVADQPTHGTAAVVGGQLEYTPDGDYNGPDSFTYTANDGLADSAPATVTVTVESVNDAPEADDDAYDTDEDTPLTITAPGLLSNDSDLEHDPLTAIQMSDPAHGALVFDADGSFTYTPAANWHGTDSFSYVANDGTDDSAPATVSIEVASVNDAPVCQDVTLDTDEDTPGTVAPDCSDVDGDLLTYTIGDPPSHGTAAVVSGQLEYTPDDGFNGPDSFDYKANDGLEFSNAATVTVTVEAVNDAPEADDDAYDTDEDTPLTITAPGLLSNDSDLEHDPLTAIQMSDPAHGALVFDADGSFTYTPADDWHGTDSFSYVANDGEFDSSPATVTIEVASVNDAPVCQDLTLDTDEDTPGTIAPDCSDVDGDPLTYSIASDPAHGTAVVVSGQLEYTPDDDYNGPDSFTYIANDGTVDSAPATVSVNVAEINDNPVCLDVTLNTDEDTLGTTAPNCSDVDNDPLTYAIASDPAHGTAAVVSDQLEYTPEANYNGLDSFTYTANDGLVDSNPATVNVSVGSTNDLPTAVNDTANTDEGAPVTIDVLANDSDPDGGTLSVTSASDPAHGDAAVNTDGTITYTPETDFNGTDSFTYEISDGQGGTAQALVTVEVGAVNDAPVAVDDAYQTRYKTSLTVLQPEGLLANDNDIDGDALTAVLVDGPEHGLLTFNPDGSFTYTPDADIMDGDSFTYSVTDGTESSTIATVTITIITHHIIFPWLPY